MPTDAKKFTFAGNETLRLDRFLVEQFPGISRGYLQDLILEGRVQVNGRVVRKGKLLEAGDEISVAPFVLPEERRIDPNPKIPIDLIWQSRDLLVLNKPAGLPTHPNDFSDGQTLANAVLARFPEILTVGDDHLRPGIVHRLDSDTSGLLLMARNQEAFRSLRSLFDQREIKKTYLALVLGKVEASKEIDTPLAHHPANPRKMVAVVPGTKHRSRVREAKTQIEPLEWFEDSYTLLKIRTLTGRMHQVRVHLASVEHPLAGDRLYQTSGRRAEDACGLKRHFLHACKLEFRFSEDNSWKSFESPLPPELQEVLDRLRKT